MAKGVISSAMPDLFPSPMYIAKVTAGATEGDVLITSSAAYTLLDFPAGVWIHEVGWQVTTAFTANVDLELGTSTDPNGFALVADVDATSANANMKSMSGLIAAGVLVSSDAALPAFAGVGFLIPSTGDVLSVTVNTASAATGAMDVYCIYSYGSNLPNPDVNKWERMQRTNQFNAGHGI